MVDLGAGCGSLGLGASLLGASFVLGVDVSQDALDTFKLNAEYLEVNNTDTLLSDVTSLPPSLDCFFDTVIMNPPFGTRNPGNHLHLIRS